jgi:hypothetical protein
MIGNTPVSQPVKSSTPIPSVSPTPMVNQFNQIGVLLQSQLDVVIESTQKMDELFKRTEESVKKRMETLDSLYSEKIKEQTAEIEKIKKELGLIEKEESLEVKAENKTLAAKAEEKPKILDKGKLPALEEKVMQQANEIEKIKNKLKGQAKALSD